MKLTKDTIIAFIVAFILGFMVFNGEKQTFDDGATKSAGKFMPLNGDENPLNGNAYALGSDDYMDKAMAFVDAYVDLDKEKVQSMLSEQMQPFADQMDKNESYSWKPWSMIPLKTIDGNGSFVISVFMKSSAALTPAASIPFKVDESYCTLLLSCKLDGIGSKIVPALISVFFDNLPDDLRPARSEPK